MSYVTYVTCTSWAPTVGYIDLRFPTCLNVSAAESPSKEWPQIVNNRIIPKQPQNCLRQKNSCDLNITKTTEVAPLETFHLGPTRGDLRKNHEVTPRYNRTRRCWVPSPHWVEQLDQVPSFQRSQMLEEQFSISGGLDHRCRLKRQAFPFEFENRGNWCWK